MRIGIDIDDVLVDTQSGIVNFHNERHGTSFRKEDQFSYQFWEIWGGTREEAIAEVYDFFKTDEFANLRPIAGAERAIGLLGASGHDLYAITGRSRDYTEETKQWIKRIFPHAFKDIHFSNSFSKTGTARTKAEICKELGVEVLIDDSVEYGASCAAAGVRVLLFDQPWNQMPLPEHMERVLSWDDILRKLGIAANVDVDMETTSVPTSIGA